MNERINKYIKLLGNTTNISELKSEMCRFCRLMACLVCYLLSNFFTVLQSSQKNLKDSCYVMFKYVAMYVTPNNSNRLSW